MKADGNMIVLTNYGDTHFDPPRPLIPSLAAGDPKGLATLNVARAVNVSTATSSSSGTVSLIMSGFDKTEKPPYTNHTFNHVMNFVSSTNGFEEIPGLKALAFNQLEFKLNTNPISIIFFNASVRLDKVMESFSDSGGFQFSPEALTGILTALPTVQAFLSTDLAKNYVLPPAKAVAKAANLILTVDLVDQQGLDVRFGDDANHNGEFFNGKAL